MTTKGIVMFFLFLFGLGAMANTLLGVSVLGTEGVDGTRALIGLVLGIAFIVAGIVVWKAWKE